MTRNSKRSVMVYYTFVSSLLVGFLVGTYLTSSGHLTRKAALRSSCSSKLIPLDRSPKGIESASENLHSPGLLYIGVMSTADNLRSRVTAMLDTWAQHGKVKLEIFAMNNDSASCGNENGLPKLEAGTRIITLPGVPDTSYPPQKKSFAMLKFIYDNHLNNYDWFLRADDDSYIKIEEVLRFLSKLDPSKPVIIGLPGYGRHKEDYLFGEKYCMGGNGIFLSKELLKQIGPKLSKCLRQMYTEHEDIEVGRCVRIMTGVSCISAWESSSLFYQNYAQDSIHPDNIEDIPEKRRVEALTFHSNKDSVYQYTLHLSILSDQVKNSLLRISRKEVEAKGMESLLLDGKETKEGRSVHDEFVWNDIAGSQIYSATSNVVSKITPLTMQALSETVDYGVVSYLRHNERVLSTQIGDIALKTAKYIVKPLSSEEVIADAEVRMSSNQVDYYKKKVHLRRGFSSSAVYLDEPHGIGQAANTLDSYVRVTGLDTTKSEKINFVMALSGRLENLQRFLNSFEESFLSAGENVGLTIVYFSANSFKRPEKAGCIIDGQQALASNCSSQVMSEADFVQTQLDMLSHKYSNFEANLIPNPNDSSFSRGAGLQIGAYSILNNEILFFCDVDLIFGSQLLFHIRRNTIRGKQVYYPTFFSQFDPAIVYSTQEPPENSLHISEIVGFWRTFSYGMIAIYNEDFLKTGGFDLSIHGWGLEDVRLCEAILKNTKLLIFKANEPALVHVYHDKDCPPDLTHQQRGSCRKSRAHHFGAQTFLYNLWQRKHEKKSPD